MANKLITELTAGAALTDADVFEASQGGTSVQITAEQIKDYIAADASLDSFTFTGAEAEHTFTGPWPGYKRLTLSVRCRSQRAANQSSSLILTLNADATDANYAYQQVRVSDATTASTWINSRPELHIPASTAPAGFWAGFAIEIHGADDAFHKAIEWKLLRRNGTAASDHFLYNSAGLWTGTAALTSIKLHDLNTAALEAGATLSLYGER